MPNVTLATAHGGHKADETISVSVNEAAHLLRTGRARQAAEAVPTQPVSTKKGSN